MSILKQGDKLTIEETDNYGQPIFISATFITQIDDFKALVLIPEFKSYDPFTFEDTTTPREERIINLSDILDK